MLTQLREYLKMGLGGLGECQSVRLPRSFPLIISSGYVFHRTEMMGYGCIVALAVDGMSYTPRMVHGRGVWGNISTRIRFDFHNFQGGAGEREGISIK